MSASKLPSRMTIVGMGYVGLPLAMAFSRKLTVTGYDRDPDRIKGLRNGVDHNREVSPAEFSRSSLEFTSDPSCLKDAEFIVVTVPTPVHENNDPDLGPLISASETIGAQIRGRDSTLKPPTIVFESTTFPGCTESVCAAAIEKMSGLKSGMGFKLGYSPERTNYGDADHTLASVVKVVSGHDEETTDLVQSVYELVCTAGTHRAPDIRTAEAAKVIENIQRDLNIALINELAIVFDRLGMSTSEVIAAASTKWNFMPFRPGLVGGHCIPVDPYYLTYRARQSGYEPDVILAGRRVNESFAAFIADKTVALAGGAEDLTALIMGLTFKPNISDTRNSKIVDLARQLEAKGVNVIVHDFRAADEDFKTYGLRAHASPFVQSASFDVVILATPHKEFLARPIDEITGLVRVGGVLVDITGALERDAVEAANVKYWRP